MTISTLDHCDRSPHGSRRQSGERGSDRRRERLRELCDEVLASHRVACGCDPIDARDRREARAVLRRLTPSLVR